MTHPRASRLSCVAFTRMAPTVLLATLRILASTTSSTAQIPEAPSITASSTLVLVPALVRTHSGQLVYTLKANDFFLTDDGIPQKLSLESETEGEPLALVVVIEAGAAHQLAGWHPDDRNGTNDRFHSLPTLLDAIVGNVPHRVAVVGFDSAPQLLRGFTTRLDLVDTTINDYNAEDDSDDGAAILDALGVAVDMLRTQPPQYRRAVLLLSETNDRGSTLAFEDAVHALSSTNTAIYSFAFSSGYSRASRFGSKSLPTKRVPPHPRPTAIQSIPGVSPALSNEILTALTTGVTFENPTPYPRGGCMAEAENDNLTKAAPASKATRSFDCLAQLVPPLALAKMAAIAAAEDMLRNVPQSVANLTGGEYFKFNDAKSLNKALETLINHMPNRYLLSFQPSHPHPGLHTLTLRIPAYENVTINARRNYWAEPATTTDNH